MDSSNVDDSPPLYKNKVPKQIILKTCGGCGLSSFPDVERFIEYDALAFEDVLQIDY